MPLQEKLNWLHSQGIDLQEKEIPELSQGILLDEYLNDISSTEDDDPEETFGFDFEEVDNDELPEFMDKLHESLDMFQRFKMYN